jgi:hypothetical protein
VAGVKKENKKDGVMMVMIRGFEQVPGNMPSALMHVSSLGQQKVGGGHYLSGRKSGSG